MYLQFHPCCCKWQDLLLGDKNIFKWQFAWKKWQLPPYNLLYKGIQKKRKLSFLIWGNHRLHCFKNLENCVTSPIYSYCYCCCFWCYTDYCCLLVISRETDETKKTWALLCGNIKKRHNWWLYFTLQCSNPGKWEDVFKGWRRHL